MRFSLPLLFVLLFSVSGLKSQQFKPINISNNLESPNMSLVLDLDNDTLDDILVAGGEKLFWYENTGGANFIRHSLLDSLDGFRRVCTFDWENDGDEDIFFTTYSLKGNKVAWLENDGSASFTFHLITDTISNPYAIRPFDIDQDNDIDILLTSADTDELYWLKNDGLSQFTVDTIGSYVNTFEIADLNGDNDWDIIFGRAYTGFTITEVRAFQNDGSNNFSMITLKSGFSVIHEVIVEDINGDNYFDILVPDYNGDKIVWLENDGTYNFYSTNNIITNFDGPESIALKDINNDGKKDLIAGSYNDDELYYFPGTGSSGSYSFGNGQLITDELNMISDIAIGDFDKQSHLDFIHTDKGNDELSAWMNDGNENFTRQILATSFDTPRAFDMQDLDGDGDQDFAAVSNDGDKVAWFENQGNDKFQTHTLITNYEEPYVVRIDDLDQDGDQDIIAASNSDDRVTWWSNDGSGNFTMSHIATNLNGPRGLWIEDYDSDGDKDIAVICYWLYSQSGITGAQLLVNDGQQNFSLQEIEEDIRAGINMRGGDMNNDTLTDIVISSYYYTSSKLNIAVNTGNGFSVINLGNLICEEFELIDFDDDQDIDILAVDFQYDSIYFYENLGNLQFQKQTIGHYPDLFKISCLDFDADNDLDIVFSTGKNAFTNASIYEFGIFRNTGSGAFSVELWDSSLTIIKPMEVWDYENDGDYDIVLGFDYADKLSMYKNLDNDCHLSVSLNSSGAGEICEGDTLVLFANTLDSNVNFKWYRDNILLNADTADNLEVYQSGEYKAVISDSSCSSSSNLINISTHLPDTTFLYGDICQGDTVLFNGLEISSSGNYTSVLLNKWGCDSTVFLELEVNPVYSNSINASICDGETYNFNGTMLSNSGIYTDSLQSQSGCDSIIVLDLVVNPVYSNSINASICDGETYNFNATMLSNSGIYTDSLQSQSGCDSIILLDLNVFPLPMPDLGPDTSINQSDTLILDPGGSYNSYLWDNGATGQLRSIYGSLLSPGAYDYWVEVVNSNFCSNRDSIQLIILPFTGLIGAEAATFRVYPNPAKQYLNIELDSPGNSHISLFDVSGRIVYSSEEENSFKLNIQFLRPGMYYLQLITNGKPYSIPVLKLR